MKIATWNINSARARADRILDVLTRHDLDALALQEIKCKPEQFPAADIEAAGYEVAAHGLNQWNGVAIISRVGLEDVRREFPGQPGFVKGEPEGGRSFIPGPAEARAIGARVGGINLWSLYVPNGRATGDPHYHYKLEFLRRLRDFAEGQMRDDDAAQLALVGDWNVIPTDADVWDPAAMEDGIYLTELERAAFHAFADAGMVELSRQYATNYTFWDYQKLRFPKNEGMRIDYVYASPALAARSIDGTIDRDERKGKGASDHVPVIIEFE